MTSTTRPAQNIITAALSPHHFPLTDLTSSTAAVKADSNHTAQLQNHKLNITTAFSILTASPLETASKLQSAEQKSEQGRSTTTADQ